MPCFQSPRRRVKVCNCDSGRSLNRNALAFSPLVVGSRSATDLRASVRPAPFLGLEFALALAITLFVLESLFCTKPRGILTSPGLAVSPRAARDLGLCDVIAHPLTRHLALAKSGDSNMSLTCTARTGRFRLFIGERVRLTPRHSKRSTLSLPGRTLFGTPACRSLVHDSHWTEDQVAGQATTKGVPAIRRAVKLLAPTFASLPTALPPARPRVLFAA